MSKGIGGSTAEAELASLKPWPDPAPAITAEERAQRIAHAQAIMATLKADALILVTGVDAVSIDFGTPQARLVRQMSIDLAEKHLDEGQFPAGSMGPKVRAAIDFARSSGGTAVITSAEHLLDALDPAASTGTRIVASSVMSPA